MKSQMEDTLSGRISWEQIVNSDHKWFLVVVAVLSVAVVITLPITSLLPRSPELTTSQRAIQANAARYTALGEYHMAIDRANRQRAIEADTARYSELGQFYLAEQISSTQRAQEADAGRYTGLASYYAEVEARRQRALEAESARYTGLAEYYAENQK